MNEKGRFAILLSTVSVEWMDEQYVHQGQDPACGQNNLQIANISCCVSSTDGFTDGYIMLKECFVLSRLWR